MVNPMDATFSPPSKRIKLSPPLPSSQGLSTLDLDWDFLPSSDPVSSSFHPPTLPQLPQDDGLSSDEEVTKPEEEDTFDGDEMWDNFNDDPTEEEDYSLPNPFPDLAFDPHAPPIFMNARMKPIATSEEAMRRARKLFGDDKEPSAIAVGTSSPPHHPPSSSTTVMTFGGFTSGAGTRLPPLSEEALRKARARLDGSDDAFNGAPTTSTSTTTTTFGGFTSGTGTKIPPPSDDALRKAKARLDGGEDVFTGAPTSSTSTTTTTFGGFTSGTGTKIPPPSEEALRKAKARLDGGEDVLSGAPSTSFGGFTSGTGTKLPPPSEESLRKAKARLDGDGDADADVFNGAPSSSTSATTTFGGFTSGTGTKLPPPSEEALRKAKARLDGAEDVFNDPNSRNAIVGGGGRGSGGGFKIPNPKRRTGLIPDEVDKNLTPTISRILGGGNGERTPLVAMNNFVPPKEVSTRTPIASTSSLPSPPPLPTPSRQTLKPTPLPLRKLKPASNQTPFKSPLTPKLPKPIQRLNLSMLSTPRPKQLVHKFNTPFKNGVRPVGLTPSGVVVSVKGKGKEGERTRAGKKGEGLNTVDRLFDLTPKAPRIGLKEAGFRPQTRYYEDLLSSGLPEELLSMTLPLASSYIFHCGRGPIEALRELERCGADLSLINEKWVRNHWSGVVWKLAAMGRSNVSWVGEGGWTWERGVRGLKYRYEREINNAHRSPLKRIQEQDSPPSLPMILVISEIIWDETETGAMMIVGLELSDGWYRIRSNVDETLRGAVGRGKVGVGWKVGVQGARLDSGKEGYDVLEAFEKSSLIISGNSTSLVPWDSKLGFVKKPWISLLSSITPTGGLITCLDLVVEKCFPTGFVDLKNHKIPPWDEGEERGREEEWIKGRAKAEAKLADTLESSKGEWDHIIELLREAVESVGPLSSSTSSSPKEDSLEEEPDEILDRLEDAPSKSRLISKLSPKQVHGCFTLAIEYGQLSRQQAIKELEDDLARSFPLRDVRSFRVLRVKDAQTGRKPSQRRAQLTVWDVTSMEPDFFQAGQRFLVSNVVPKGTWKRNTLEITLATRRDSKWKKVG